MAPVDAYSEQDRLCIDTIRTLAIDAVQAAVSGHPGAPLSLAPTAYVLFARIMRHNPADPAWPDRDRFVLSAGHASMLLYASLHLSGYDLTLDAIKRFRQLGSLTPGHPEFRHTAGVETTTGPLGQGFANGVGMAMAERFLRERYGSEIVDHRVFAVCSDGDLMEGISSEAASIAGHLGLGRMVYLYDDNRITIDGSTDLLFSENVTARFEAQGWHTLEVDDGEDLEAIETAVRAGIAEEERPTLIRLRTVIANHSPGKRGSSKAHGEALGVDEVAATKRALGWEPELHFHIPEGVREHFDHRGRGAADQGRWEERFAAWARGNPELAAEWRAGQAGKVGNGLAAALPVFDPAETPKLATRAASGKVFEAMSPFVPTMVGGAADLVGSTKTIFPGGDSYTPEHAGRNVHWGVREHAMTAAVNGLALHGGIVKPYGSTFFVFTDYMRPSIRLSALMELDVVWVLTHDSVAVGEDGPTHQPIEHLAALRAIPGLTVIRPADANETVEAWRVALEDVRGPALLVLTRQDLPVLEGTRDGLARGAYVLADSDSPDAVLVATGSEVWVALAARDLLIGRGIQVHVVSMPSWELFAAQAASYQQEVLPAGMPKISLEAASTFGWARWVDHAIGIDSFGASGPGGEVLAHFGIAPEAVAHRVAAALGEAARAASRVKVGFTPAEQASAPLGIVIDVLRATSTICQALASGFERVICVGEIDDARALAGPGVALAGERGNVRIGGFDFGNSPREFAGELPGSDPLTVVSTLVLTTTNGTRLLLAAAARCDEVLVASLLNLDAVVRAVREADEVAVLCAGVEGAFAIDDAYVAGRIAAALGGEPDDAAVAAVRLAAAFETPDAGIGGGFSAANIRNAQLDDDIPFCARESVLDVVPRVVARSATAVEIATSSRP